MKHIPIVSMSLGLDADKDSETGEGVWKVNVERLLGTYGKNTVSEWREFDYISDALEFISRIVTAELSEIQ
jgi:hypothetical protein